MTSAWQRYHTLSPKVSRNSVLSEATKTTGSIYSESAAGSSSEEECHQTDPADFYASDSRYCLRHISKSGPSSRNTVSSARTSSIHGSPLSFLLERNASKRRKWHRIALKRHVSKSRGHAAHGSYRVRPLPLIPRPRPRPLPELPFRLQGNRDLRDEVMHFRLYQYRPAVCRDLSRCVLR